MCYSSRMNRDKIFPVRLSEEEEALIVAIQDKTGFASGAEVLRQGLRAFAEKLKIKSPKKP